MPRMQEHQQQKPTRRGNARADRLAKRKSSAASAAVRPGVSGGAYKPLTDAEMDKVAKAALDILEQVGVGDATQALLDIVLPKGCRLNEHGRVCFPVSLMEDIIANAASSYTVYARGSRAGNDDIHCSANKVYTSTAGSAVTTFDAQTRDYRASTILDVYDFTRLTDLLENIHMVGDTVVATDLVDDFEHDMNVAYALMAATQKPLCMSFRNAKFIHPAIEMFDMVLGGEGKFLNKPFCIFGGCPIVSPLKFGRENLEVLIEASRLGLVSDIAVAPQSGATAPATLAGILAQVIAETLACLAVVNLVRPGCGMTFAAWPFITDLRTGSFSGGGGEQALLAAAAVQMGNYFNLPNSVGASMSDSKIPDAQAGFEKGISLTLAAQAGCNRICEAAGMLGNLMGCSFESLVIDNEAIGMALRTVRGIEITDESLSVDIIKQAVIDPGHFLGHAQTLEVMETEYLYPRLADRNNQSAWKQDGSQDLLQRATGKVSDILAVNYPNYIGEKVDAKIRGKFPIRIATSDMQASSKRW